MKDEFVKSAFNDGRMEAVVKCSMIMIAEKRPDIARDIFKTMNIDKERLALLRKKFSKRGGR